MTLDEQIEILENNAEFERKDGDLNSCLNFRQLAEWLKDYKRLKEQKPCNDAISRRAVEEIVNDIRDCISVEGYWAILERLKKLPSVTQKPETVTGFADRCRECGKRNVKRQTGHWIEKQEEDDCEPFILWQCSNCHNTVLRGHFRKYSYCPNCGAKMIETQERSND